MQNEYRPSELFDPSLNVLMLAIIQLNMSVYDYVRIVRRIQFHLDSYLRNLSLR